MAGDGREAQRRVERVGVGTSRDIGPERVRGDVVISGTVAAKLIAQSPSSATTW